jgi:hypothetical protein
MDSDIMELTGEEDTTIRPAQGSLRKLLEETRRKYYPELPPIPPPPENT